MAVLNEIPMQGNPTFVQDIIDTLNYNGGLVRHPLGAFTMAANINMWAKYKPENNAALPALTDEMRRANKYGLTVRGNRIAMGLTFGNNTPADVYNWIKNTNVGVTYKMPTGGSSSPYRMNDFCGYYPNALPPLLNTFNDGDQWGTDDKPLGGIVASDIDGTKQLTQSDIYQSDTTLRRGMYVTDGSNDAYCTDVLPMSKSSWISRFAGSGDNYKTVTVMEFLTDVEANFDSIGTKSLNWEEYKLFLLPRPIYTIKIKGKSYSPPEGVVGSIVFSTPPSFVIGSNYKRIVANFRINVTTKRDINSLAVRIHKTATGGGPDLTTNGIIAYKNLGDFKDLQIGNVVGPFNIAFDNPDGLSSVYFVIVYNYEIRYQTMVMQYSTLE